MAMPHPIIELFMSATVSRDRYYYRVRGRNGEVVVTSEGYSTRSGARRAANRLKDIVAQALPA